MTRVLQIHTKYREPGGEDAVADRERRLLEENGHEVLAVRLSNAEGGARAAMQLGTYGWSPVTASRLMRIAREARPEVAHLHNTWYALSPTVLGSLKRAGIPTVVSLHNYRLACVNSGLQRGGRPCELCLGKVPWRGVRHRCYRDSAAASAAAALGIQIHRLTGTWKHNVDLFLALTDFARQKLVLAGLPEGRIVVKPNFTPDPGPRPAAPSASRRIAFIGRLSPEKGLALALTAWRRAELPNLELAIAGEGPERRSLEARAPASVRFLGRLDRGAVDELLHSSRAVLLPAASYEAQPLGALEAMAAGAPVLGSDLGGVGETIRPLGPAWSVSPHTVAAWAKALSRLADDRFVDAGGLAARRTYEERHSPARGAEALERRYRSVLDKAS
jgi:glycosyltransferase involved in cell wall biosynthesis